MHDEICHKLFVYVADLQEVQRGICSIHFILQAASVSGMELSLYLSGLWIVLMRGSSSTLVERQSINRNDQTSNALSAIKNLGISNNRIIATNCFHAVISAGCFQEKLKWSLYEQLYPGQSVTSPGQQWRSVV